MSEKELQGYKGRILRMNSTIMSAESRLNGLKGERMVAVRGAAEAGVPRRVIAEWMGVGEEWVRQLLAREDA